MHTHGHSQRGYFRVLHSLAGMMREMWDDGGVVPATRRLERQDRKLKIMGFMRDCCCMGCLFF